MRMGKALAVMDDRRPSSYRGGVPASVYPDSGKLLAQAWQDLALGRPEVADEGAAGGLAVTAATKRLRHRADLVGRVGAHAAAHALAVLGLAQQVGDLVAGQAARDLDQVAPVLGFADGAD